MPKLRRQLTQKQSSKLRRVFDSHDQGGKGTLSFVEFQTLMRALGQEMELARCQEMVIEHARAHHEEHYGEDGFVEEDIDHITFALFCSVVKGAAAKTSQSQPPPAGSASASASASATSSSSPSTSSSASSQQDGKLRSVFDAHDDGSKNCLTFSEFQTLMKSLGRDVPMDELLDMVKTHAREHHVAHFGEDNFVEEDLQHISFDLFCFVVKGAATQRNRRRLAGPDITEDEYQEFLSRRMREKLPDDSLPPYSSTSPAVQLVLYKKFAQSLPPGHEIMPTSELSVSVEHVRKNIIVGSGVDPTLTQQRIRDVLELPSSKKKDWKQRNKLQPHKKAAPKDGLKPSPRYVKTKGAELTFDDIMLVLHRGPEDKVLWTAKRLERSKVVRAEFLKMDADDSKTIHVSTELVAGLEELTGAAITDDHARALANRVHTQQNKQHSERNIDPDLLDYSQFCFLVAMVKHEEDAWQEYVEARKISGRKDCEDIIPMYPRRRAFFSFFRDMDRDDTGEIGPDALLRGLHNIGRTDLTLSHVHELLSHEFQGKQKVDAGGDNKFDFDEFITIMWMILGGAPEVVEEVVKNVVVETPVRPNLTHREWWWTIPFGFCWPGEPQPGDDCIVWTAGGRDPEEPPDPDETPNEKARLKDTSATLSAEDVQAVKDFLKMSGPLDALGHQICSQAVKNFNKMTEHGGGTRLKAEKFLLATFSPFDGLHLFFWSGNDDGKEGGAAGVLAFEDDLGDDTGVTSAEASKVDEYLRKKWRKPGQLVKRQIAGRERQIAQQKNDASGSGNMSKSETAALFAKLDADRSGTLDAAEFARGLKAVDPSLRMHDVAGIVQDFDRNKDGMLSQTEFHAAVQMLRRRKRMGIISSVDENNRGKVEANMGPDFVPDPARFDGMADLMIDAPQLEAARCALVPAAEAGPGNRTNPITRLDAQRVARATVQGEEPEAIARLTGCILGLPGFRWPAGAASPKLNLDRRDWNYIINHYFHASGSFSDDFAGGVPSNVGATGAKRFSESAYLDNRLADIMRWAIIGMSQGGAVTQSTASTALTQKARANRGQIEKILRVFAKMLEERRVDADDVGSEDSYDERAERQILDAVPKAFQPAGMPAASIFAWPSKCGVDVSLVELDDDDRAVLVKSFDVGQKVDGGGETMSGGNAEVRAAWKDRWRQEERRRMNIDNSRGGGGGGGARPRAWTPERNQVALRCMMSTQCVTRKDAERVIQALVLGMDVERIKRSVPPIWLLPDSEEEEELLRQQQLQRRQEEEQGLEHHEPEDANYDFRWDDPGPSTDAMTPAMVAECTKFVTEACDHPKATPQQTKACLETVADARLCSDRGDAQKILQAWCELRSPAFIRGAACSGFAWPPSRKPNPKGNLKRLDVADRAFALKFIDTRCRGLENSKEKCDVAATVLDECIVRLHAERLIGSLWRLESPGEIELAPRLAGPSLPHFAWSCPGTAVDELRDEDRRAAKLWIEKTTEHMIEAAGAADGGGVAASMGKYQDAVIKALSGTNYRGDAENVLKAWFRGGHEHGDNGGSSEEEKIDAVMDLAPGAGGVPNYFWPSFGMPRDALSTDDMRFAKGFSTALADLALMSGRKDKDGKKIKRRGNGAGVSAYEAFGGGDAGEERITSSEAKKALSLCASRRQAECMLECMCDDGTDEEVGASLYLGRWRRSRVLPPTEAELAAAAKAEELYRSRRLWRKATNAKFNTGAMTDAELNIMAATAIDVASRTLGMSHTQSSCCRRAVLHSRDDTHRASVIECCLDRKYVESGDGAMSNKVMKTVRRAFNATVLKSLILDSDLPEHAKQKGVAGIVPKLGSDEDARGQHLIDTLMAVAEGENGNGDDGGGGGGAGGSALGLPTGIRVDRRHRAEFEKTINSVITFDAKRKKTILAAIHEADRWCQLTEIFAAAIRGEGNKTIKKCAFKELADILFRPGEGNGQSDKKSAYVEGIKVCWAFTPPSPLQTYFPACYCCCCCCCCCYYCCTLSRANTRTYARAHTINPLLTHPPTQSLSHSSQDMVRTSYMHEGISSSNHVSLHDEIDQASTHYELCHALLGVIKSYSDLVSEMQKKRAGTFSATQYNASGAAGGRSAGGNSSQKFPQSTKLPALAATAGADRSYSGGRGGKNSSPGSGRSGRGLDDIAKSNAGDILGQLGTRQDGGAGQKSPSGPPLPTMTQEEAFAQIKGVDYSMRGTQAKKKKKKKNDPNRPEGVRSAAMGRSPRNKKRGR